MDDVPAEIRQLLLVDACRIAEHIALLGRQQNVLVHGMVHLVNGVLAVFHHIDVPKARGAVLLHEEHIEHKGILSVVIQAPVRQLRVILAGVQHNAVAELAVVQHPAARRVRALVVPIHHHALVRGVHAVLVDVAGYVQHPGGMACQLGILGRQLGSVLQAQAEKVGRVLNVRHARLPVEHEQVHGPHGDVSHAAPLGRVPEDAGDAGALLELAPPGVAVHLFIVCLFQHHRQYAGQRPGRLLVVCRPGQHIGFRVVIHGIGVLVGDAVEQPPAGRLGLAGHHGVRAVLPVAHAEPQFVVHQTLVQGRFARLVALQDLHCLCHFCCTHRQRFVLIIVHRVSPFHLDPPSSGELSAPESAD